MKKWIILGVGIIGAAVVGAVIARRPQKVQIAQPAAPRVIPAQDVVLTGRVTARTVVTVSSPIEGTLETFFVDAGAEVIQGQLLGRVRNSKAMETVQQSQDAVDQARARLTELGSQQLAAKLEISRAEAEQSRARNDLERLQKAYERQKGLWAAGATARLTFEKSEKDYNDAKEAMVRLDAVAKDAAARVESIAREIESANRVVAEKSGAAEHGKEEATSGELHAPADGIVTTRLGKPGDMVDPSTKLVEIATGLTELRAVVTADVATQGRIHIGQPVTVKIGELEVPGTVQDVHLGEIVVFFNTAEPIHSAEMPAQVRIKF